MDLLQFGALTPLIPVLLITCKQFDSNVKTLERYECVKKFRRRNKFNLQFLNAARLKRCFNQRLLLALNNCHRIKTKEQRINKEPKKSCSTMVKAHLMSVSWEKAFEGCGFKQNPGKKNNKVNVKDLRGEKEKSVQTFQREKRKRDEDNPQHRISVLPIKNECNGN